jgi:hypothetical protein
VAREGRTDYRMQRRAVLRDVQEGRRSYDDVRDAHPDLLRAGSHLGHPVRAACPLCQEQELREVSYVFEVKGRTRTPGGRAIPRDALVRYAERHGDLTVYNVEVCLGCHWHHLVESFRLLARGSAVG